MGFVVCSESSNQIGLSLALVTLDRRVMAINSPIENEDELDSDDEFERENSRAIPPDDKGCPICGQELVVRVNRSSGEEFLGCRGYVYGCTFTAPY